MIDQGQSFADKRAAGSILMIQTIVAALIAESPRSEAILQGAKVASARVQEEADAAMVRVDIDEFTNLSEMASGANDTLDYISAFVQLMQKT